MPHRTGRLPAALLTFSLAGAAVALTARAQPMGTSIPGPGPAQAPAPVPGSSVGADTPGQRDRMLAAEKCGKLDGAEKDACLQQARRQGRDSPRDAGTIRERGSEDRVGPGSAGMAGGTPR